MSERQFSSHTLYVLSLKLDVVFALVAGVYNVVPLPCLLIEVLLTRHTTCGLSLTCRGGGANANSSSSCSSIVCTLASDTSNNINININQVDG